MVVFIRCFFARTVDSKVKLENSAKNHLQRPISADTIFFTPVSIRIDVKFMTWQLGSSARFVAGAAIALLAASIFSPGRAFAECGDYVMVGGKHAPMASHNETGPVGIPSPAPCPCHGPGCSRQPQAPILPPAPAPTVTPTEWACLVASVQDGSVAIGRVTDQATAIIPMGCVGSIFHPPRLSA
jgi:hypothetical protein